MRAQRVVVRRRLPSLTLFNLPLVLPLYLIVGAGFVALYVARYVSGRPVFTKRKTDATFLKRATGKYDERDRVWWWWSGRPEWQRAAMRVGVAMGVVIEVSLWRYAPVLMVALDLVVVVVLAWMGVRLAVKVWRTRTVRREIIQPLQAALQHRLSVPAHTPVEQWLKVPLGYRKDPEKRVVIALPQGFDREAHGASVERLALDRLRIAEPVVSWYNYGPNPVVTIGARLAPPAKVTLAEVMPAILAAKETDLVLGKGSGEKIVSVSYWLDSPHLALSAPSQSGKSTAIACLLAQQMRWGSFALIFDFRAESHTWAFNLPNAVVLTDLDRIHAGLLAMWAEVQRRQQLVKAAARAGGPRPVFPRVWVALEELNLTMPALRQFWADYRAADPERAKRLPKVSPAITTIANLSYAGRSVGFHGIFVAQRLTAAATGDPTGAVRESLGIRYMIKPKDRTWRMLADGAAMPKFGRDEKGRAHVVVDGHSEEVQGTYATEEELIALSTSGTITEKLDVFAALESGPIGEELMTLSGHGGTVGGSPVEAIRTADSGQLADAPAGRRPGAVPAQRQELEAPKPVYLTLEEAVEQGILTGKVESLARTLRRDAKNERPLTPEMVLMGGQRKYDRDDLTAWRDSRRRTDDAENEYSDESEQHTA